MRFILLALVPVVFSGCPSSPAPGLPGVPSPGCESVKASLKATTFDHQPTITAVELKSSGGGAGCTLTGTCTPTATTACAEVTVTAGPGTTACELTFTSTTGQAFVASATVKSTRAYRCIVNGKSVQQYDYAFQPAAITVDFDGEADAGPDGSNGSDGGDGGDSETGDILEGGTPPAGDAGEEAGADAADGEVEGEVMGEVAAPV